MDQERGCQKRIWRDGGDTICYFVPLSGFILLWEEDSSLHWTVWTYEKGPAGSLEDLAWNLPVMNLADVRRDYEIHFDLGIFPFGNRQ
jgi:hypothetical protein